MSAPKEGPGHYIAAGIRLDAREGRIESDGWTVGECRECGRTIYSLQFDGLCSPTSCGGDAEFSIEQTKRRAEALRRLHRDAAAMLRRIGHPEEADYHDRMGR